MLFVAIIMRVLRLSFAEMLPDDRLGYFHSFQVWPLVQADGECALTVCYQPFLILRYPGAFRQPQHPLAVLVINVAFVAQVEGPLEIIDTMQ